MRAISFSLPFINVVFNFDFLWNCSDDSEKTISSGFFRLEKGTPLVYSYWYDEMKIILEGEFHISDECGNSVIGKPGDVFKFPKGCKITFETPTMGLAFFVGQRETGKL